MNTAWKKYRVLLTAAGMAVCMTAGLVMGIGWSRSHTENMAVQAAEHEMTDEEAGRDEADAFEEMRNDLYGDKLYKEAVPDEEIVKKVCDKFGLDYDTVPAKDVTKEMYNYEEALWLVKDMGDCPLLKDEAGEDTGDMALSSLEAYICDIYAFGDGKAVIESMCGEFGIDPHKTVISDLTAEQLVQIGEKAFETSDH